jgi:hypothetical protein
MFTRLLVGALLLAHGGVHLLYLTPAPEDDSSWPFDFANGWAIPESARRGVGIAVIAAIAAMYLLVALAIWGVPGMHGLIRPLLITGSVLSLALFAAYWHPWLSFGVLIAVALAVIAITDPGWWEHLID